jgi:amino acid adenylation domain-containing protein
VNTLVLRSDFGGRPRVRELLQQVREVTLGAYEHQDVPFEKLVEELQPERDLVRSPLFQVMFTLQNAPQQEPELGGLKVQGIGAELETAKFEMMLTLSEHGGRLAGSLVYQRGLFAKERMRRMLGHLEILLVEMVGNPKQRIDEIPLLSVIERRTLEEWNSTARDYPHERVSDLFEMQAERTPKAVAVISGVCRLSYGELNRRASRLARYLRGKRVGPDVRVGICLERSPEMVVAVLAVLKAGGTYVPLDLGLPPDRLEYMIGDARMEILLADSKAIKSLPSGDIPVVAMEGGAKKPAWLEEAEQDENGHGLEVSGESLAYILYTSGSTGRPKGVMVSHRGLSNYLAHAVATYMTDQIEGSVVSLPLSFDATLTTLLTPLLVGKRVELLAEDEAALSRLAERMFRGEQGLLFKVTPAHLEALEHAKKGAEVGTAQHRIVVGGEQLGAERLRRWKAELLPNTIFVNEYGPTETVVGCSVWALEAEAGMAELIRRAAAPIGGPIGNTQLYVLGEGEQLQPRGSVGELYISGAGLARGYLNQAELTAERFVPNAFSDRAGERLYRTGDLVRWAEDGNLEFLGRRDHQVKLRGYRIELGEIEATLNRHEGVRESVVVVRGSTAEDKRLVAYVVQAEADTATLTSAGLQSHLQEKLPEYMVPWAYVFLKQLPLTPNGKLDRKALPDPEPTVSASILPRDPMELELIRIWEDILKTAPLGVNQSFFDLGGHSLLAIRMVSAIEAKMKVRLPLLALFQYPTVEGLASVLRNMGPEIPRTPLVEIQRGGSRRPLFFVHGAGGSAFVYTALVRHLGPEQPLFAFHDPGLESAEAGESSVELAAQRYVQALRGKQPYGPYQLGGWSTGALVAFEMARQLEQQGEKVVFLAILDRPAVQKRIRAVDDAIFNTFLINLGLPKEEFANAGVPGDPLETRLALTHQLVTRARLLPPNVDSSMLRRWYDVLRKNVLASFNYKLAKTNLPLHVWYARENATLGEDRFHRSRLDRILDHFRTPDPSLGWASVAGKVQLSDTPGHHFNMLSEPHVSHLAKELADCLEEITNQIK